MAGDSVYEYSQTPANNNAAPPAGWPEGMSRPDVNDTARRHYADVAIMLADFPWMNFAKERALTRTSATRLTITGVDLSLRYTKRRRIKITGTTPPVAYGTIYAVSFSAGNTLVDCYMEGDVGVPTSPTKAEVSLVEYRAHAGELFLREQLPAAAAQVDITDVIDGDFDQYVIRIDDLLMATNATDLRMRFDQDNGASFDTGNNYYWRVLFSSDFPGSAALGAAAVAFNDLTGAAANFQLSNAANATAAGWIRILARGTASLRSYYEGSLTYLADSGFRVHSVFGGEWQGGAALNAVRLLSSSGNITRARIRTYGCIGTPS